MIQIHVGYRQMHACMLCVPVNRPRHLFSAFTAKGLRKNNGSKTFNCGNVEKVCAVEYFVYICCYMVLTIMPQVGSYTDRVTTNSVHAATSCFDL